MRAIQWGYVVLLLTPALVQFLNKVHQDAGGFSSRYGVLLFSVVLVIGYWAHCRKRPMWTRWFWRGYYWLSCILLGGALLFGLYLLTRGLLLEGAMLLMALVVFIPALLMLQRYSSAQNRLWSE